MRVSIIVPIYNVEYYLDRCVQSLLQQNFDDYEILLIDDGSTDQSGHLAQQYELEYPDRIKTYHKENGGLSDARNYGIDRARGDYFAFIDSDDYIAEDFIQKLYNKALTSHADVVVCDMIEFTDNTETVYVSGGDFDVIDCCQDASILFDLTSACNKLFHKNCFIDIRFPKGLYYEDIATIPKIYYQSSVVAKISEGLYYYYQRTGSIIHKETTKIFDIYWGIQNVIDFMKQKTHIIQEKYIQNMYSLMVIHGAELTTLRIKDYQDKGIKKEYLTRNWACLAKYYPNWFSDSCIHSYSVKKKIMLFLFYKKRFSLLLILFNIRKLRD